jgi:hypothetical protein
MTRSSRIPPVLALVALLAVTRAARSDEQDVVPGPIRTSVAIPFAGRVFHPDTNENVLLAGSLRVRVSANLPNDPVKVTNRYKLGTDVSAVGETSGATYRVRGADTVRYFVPSNPIRYVVQNATFQVIPPVPIAPGNPIRTWQLEYRVGYDAAGQLASTQAMIVDPPEPGACLDVARVCRP